MGVEGFVRKHLSNASMLTQHQTHTSPIYWCPPINSTVASWRSGQHSESRLRWNIKFRFIMPCCLMNVLCYILWFIRESVPGNCPNNIKRTSRNITQPRVSCQVYLTVILTRPWGGNSAGRGQRHNTNNSLFDLLFSLRGAVLKVQCKLQGGVLQRNWQINQFLWKHYGTTANKKPDYCKLLQFCLSLLCF